MNTILSLKLNKNNQPFIFFLPVNLWRIYKAVEKLGGYDSVSARPCNLLTDAKNFIVSRFLNGK